VSFTEAQNIYYSGRVTQKDQSSVIFDWSAVRIDYSFTGTSIDILLQDYNNLYEVYLDGQAYTTVNVTDSQTTYSIASGLSNGTFTSRVG
jgi:hypothetical protein